MTLRIAMSMSIREDDPIVLDIRRASMSGESSSKALRRIITRYSEMLNNTPPSPGEVVRDLARVIVEHQVDLIGRMNYPRKDEVISLIHSSTVEAHVRKRLAIFIEQTSFTEYAKLIEAVELMYRA
jgi:hypothetical protein